MHLCLNFNTWNRTVQSIEEIIVPKLWAIDEIPTYRDPILGWVIDGSINYGFQMNNLRAPFNSIASNYNFWFTINDSLGKRFCRKTGKYNLNKSKATSINSNGKWNKSSNLINLETWLCKKIVDKDNVRYRMNSTNASTGKHCNGKLHKHGQINNHGISLFHTIIFEIVCHLEKNTYISNHSTNSIGVCLDGVFLGKCNFGGKLKYFSLKLLGKIFQLPPKISLLQKILHSKHTLSVFPSKTQNIQASNSD